MFMRICADQHLVYVQHCLHSSHCRVFRTLCDLEFDCYKQFQQLEINAAKFATHCNQLNVQQYAKLIKLDSGIC